MKFKEILKVTGLPVLFASLCCLSPVVLVLFGISTVSFASSLADTFYGEYKWYFRLFGLVTLFISLFIYFKRNVGICTIDDAIRRRNEIINKVMIVLIAGVISYIFFLYVVVHYIGVFLDIWK